MLKQLMEDLAFDIRNRMSVAETEGKAVLHVYDECVEKAIAAKLADLEPSQEIIDKMAEAMHVARYKAWPHAACTPWAEMNSNKKHAGLRNARAAFSALNPKESA